MRFRHAYDPFRALAGAVRLVRVGPLTLIVGAILASLLTPEVSLKIGRLDLQAAVLACATCVLGLGLLLVWTLFNLGFATAVERVAVTGVERLPDLWEPRGRYLSLLFGRLLQLGLFLFAFLPFGLLAGGAAWIGEGIGGDEAALVLGILTLLVTSPAYVFLWLGLALVVPAVALERRAPVDAVRRSWTLVRGNRLWLFWFLLVQTVVAFAGFCLCCVGIVATTALTHLAWFEAYLRLVRDDQDLWATEGGAGASLWSTGPDRGP